jgi:hypothetical protein
MLWRGLSSLWGTDSMENGINQSAELRILGAKTTGFSWGNYGEGGLDTVAEIQLSSCRAYAHPFNLIKRLTIRAGLFTFATLKIYEPARGYFGFTKACTIARQTSEIPFAIHGLFQCFFADFVFFFRHISNRKGAESFRCRSVYTVQGVWGTYRWRWTYGQYGNYRDLLHRRHKQIYQTLWAV